VTEPALAHATLDTRITLASDAAIEARTRGESQVQLTHAASHADPREQHKRGLELSTTVLSRIRAMEVELYLQPFVPLSNAAASANINGELLCRLRDRDGRIIMPHLFVEQLQADRRMAELDLAMVRQLNRWLHEHEAMIPSIGRFYINLAGQSLASRGFSRDLFAQLDSFILPADRLCFEVTETAAIAYQAESLMLFEQLRERGCHIGIDDFGVGFQSFERLKQIPADVIKIDGSFVRDMTHSAYDLSVVRATVMIAQELKAQTVAEHVADADTAQALRALNVDWAQGFFFATPLPIDEAIKRVRETAII
jgi:EAL domain-containing protein (putative c-di-GMP-specific phosphodiesterase class I)